MDSSHNARLTVSFTFVLLVLISCNHPSTAREGTVDTAAVSLLTKSIEKRIALYSPVDARALLSRNFPDSMRVVAESSAVVPGLRYYMGVFVPAYDARFAATVGTARGEARMLDSPDDWAVLAARVGWIPTGAKQALTACKEIVQHAMPAARMRARPIIFEDTTSFLQAVKTSLLEPDLGRVLAWARSPTVTTSGSARGKWRVELWAVEFGRSDEFACTLDTSEKPLHVSLVAVDSLPCAGQFASCSAPVARNSP